ncbi:hypothetical protein NQZ68_022629 [Dissostichus eleginoides]|nr:hypothetical protein NQZ68_022629 [Dissostichus eleginoides]
MLRGRGGWGRRRGPGHGTGHRKEAAGEGRGPTRARAPPPGGGGACNGTGRRKGAAVGVVANEENIRQPQKAGSLCDVGTGVNTPVVPSREERCPAAGEGTAAAGTKPSGGRSRGQGRGQTGQRPKPPSRRTVSRG